MGENEREKEREIIRNVEFESGRRLRVCSRSERMLRVREYERERFQKLVLRGEGEFCLSRQKLTGRTVVNSTIVADILL